MRQQRAAEARRARRARGRRPPLRLPRPGRPHLDDEKRRRVPRGAAAPLQPGPAIRCRAAGRRRHRARTRPTWPLFERQGKKAYARLGAMRVVMDEDDAAQASALDRAPRQQAGHRATSSRCASPSVESKHGRGKKAYVETVEVAQLAQRPEVQGALVAVDPAERPPDGDGGRLRLRPLAVQPRHPGAAPGGLVHQALHLLGGAGARLHRGLDGPGRAGRGAAPRPGCWSPHNYKPEFLGPVTLRTALQKSLNTVSVRLVEAIGVDKVIEQIRKFGITAQIVRHPSIALGTPEVTLLEHVYGYATFPAGGMEVTPVFIDEDQSTPTATSSRRRPGRSAEARAAASPPTPPTSWST